jgi:hypothetical protein
MPAVGVIVEEERSRAQAQEVESAVMAVAVAEVLVEFRPLGFILTFTTAPLAKEDASITLTIVITDTLVNTAEVAVVVVAYRPEVAAVVMVLTYMELVVMAPVAVLVIAILDLEVVEDRVEDRVQAVLLE